jgi:hypothetical protein
MSTTFVDHHHSVTVHTDSLAVVGCLRALAQHAQKTGNARIVWGHTKKEDWLSAGNKVTFRFSSTGYRAGFEEQAAAVLRDGLFSIVSRRDDDPATPAT